MKLIKPPTLITGAPEIITGRSYATQQELIEQYFGRGFRAIRNQRVYRKPPTRISSYDKVLLSTEWLEGEYKVKGTIRSERILEDPDFAPLGIWHLLPLLENPERAPDPWYDARGFVTFDASKLIGPDNKQYVPCWNCGAGPRGK